MKKAVTAAGILLLFFGASYGSEGGRVIGKLKAKWVDKYQTVVFLRNTPVTQAGPRAERPVMDQKDRILIPRILPVVVGTTVEFRNDDPFKHNLFSPDGERYNLGTWEQGKSKAYAFKKPGVYRQLCNVHPEMLAYIVVLETPYFALSDHEGNFEIDGVPSGKYLLGVWGEKLTKEQLAGTFEVLVEEGARAYIEINFLQ